VALTPEAPALPAGTPGAAGPGVAPTEAALTAAAVQKTTEVITKGLADAYSDNRGNVLLIVPPRDLAESTFSRAIPIDWQQLQASNGQRGDVVLRDGDILYVPTRPTLILVAGAVQNQGAQRYVPGLKVKDALAQAGGAGSDAELGRMMVIHANGQMNSVQKLTAQLQPGDALIVPSTYIIRNIHSQSGLERIMSFLAATVAGFRYMF